jgi:hypothetical protein
MEKDRSESDYKQQLYARAAQLTDLDNTRSEQERLVNH